MEDDQGIQDFKYFGTNDMLEKPQNEQQISDHKTLNHISLYHNFIQRYFDTYTDKSEWFWIHLHSNGIVLISMNAYKVMELKIRPLKVNLSLEATAVKGKKKRGGTKVTGNTIIGTVQFDDGKQLELKALLDGSLLQVNEQINVHNLLSSEGYLIILMPTKKFKHQKYGFKKQKWLE